MWVAEEKIKLLKDCGLHENTYRSTTMCMVGESICLTAIVKQIMLTYYKWAEKSEEFRMTDDEFLVWDSCQKCLIEKNGILKKQMSFGIKLYQSISLDFELEVDLFRGNNDISIYLSPKDKSPLSCNQSTVRYVASNLLGFAKGLVRKTDYTVQVLQAMQRYGNFEWSEECNQEGQLPKVILKKFPGTQDTSAALEKEKITGAEHVENTNCIDALMSIVVEIIKQKVYSMSNGIFSYKYLAFKVKCGTSSDTIILDQALDTTYFKRESKSFDKSGEALDGGGLNVDYKQVVTIKIDVINHKRFATNKEGNPLSSLLAAPPFVADEVLLKNMELKFHFTNAEIYLEFVPGEIAPTLDNVYKVTHRSSYYSGLSHYVAYMAGFERYQQGESEEEKFIMKFDAAWAKKSKFDDSWVKTIAMMLLASNAQGY